MEKPVDKNDVNSTSPEPESKRRKLRKGTQSCWDCKRRKVKCTFESVTDTACIACRRRGAACVGQEHPEEEVKLEDGHGQLFGHIVKVEALLEDLVKKIGPYVERDGNSAGLGPSGRQKSGVLTPFSDFQVTDSFMPSQQERSIQRGKEPAACEQQLPTPESIALTPGIPVPEGDQCTKLSQDLLEAFPSQEDIDILCKSDYEVTLYFHQLITKADIGPDHEAYDFVNELAKIPSPSTHPVLVAKRMFIFASFLQYLPPQRVGELVEQASVVVKRLTDTAIRLVTTNEEMVGCMEGLECIVLEGIFQVNTGNLRRAWLAFRRAMVTAQLMRMDRPNPSPIKTIDPSTRMHPTFMWFRIVYMDRFLSLMLGLPQGCSDLEIEYDIPEERPSCKLQHTHAVIAGRILERNKHDPLLQDFATTQELDVALLDVAKTMPDTFWLPPNFANLQGNTLDAFRETMRLADQLHHYNLVHLLHLPCLLRCDEESYHKYSKITCVNASREILTRFVAFRNFNSVTACCRIADFFALMAGMTILLAHIDSHRQCTDNFLAHQRLSDRAMVKQVIENMDDLAKQTGDVLTAKSSDLLRCLLKVETEAVQNEVYNAHTAVSCLEKECSVLQVPIPYFGIVKIAPEGIISKDWPVQQISQPPGADEAPVSIHVANHVFSFGSEPILHQIPNATPLLPIPNRQPVPFQTEAQLAIATENSSRQQQALHPGLTAGVDDWAFQGVDAAFFDSLMRSTWI